MHANSPAIDEGAQDLIRQIVGWCADVCEASPHAVRHDGPCGRRFFCPRHRDDGYRRAEVLPNGHLILHCEGETLTPSDLGYSDRLAELVA
jgi:hypothetical protein